MVATSGRISVSVQLGQAVQNLQTLRQSLEHVDTQATKSNKTLGTIRTVLGHSNTSIRQTRDAVRELVGAYERQTQALNTLIQSQQRLSNAQKATKSQMEGITSSVVATVAAVVSFAAAWRGFQTTLGKSVQIDSITKTFFAIQGSMGGAAIEMSYVRGEAQRLGLDFFALAESFKGFSAATKFANFDLSTTKDMFSSVAESASVLGLSGDKTKLVLMALEQMVSKGVVSMEELRRQLGDSLPGAFELGAKAMNMGLAEFNKFVASGKLMSEEFLPKFTKTLRETYATAENVGMAMKTPRAEIERFMNAITFAQDHFARVGFLSTVVEGVRELTKTLESPEAKKDIAELGQMFGVLVSAGLKVVEFGIAYGAQLVSLATMVGLLIAAEKLYMGGLNLLTMNWQKSGTIASALATTYGTLKTAIISATVASNNAAAVAATTPGILARVKTAIFSVIGAFQGAGIAAGILTGGLVLLVGWLASLAIPKVLGFMSGFSAETKIADNLAQQLGTSVGEAESQISRFMAVIGKPDPFAPFDRSIAKAQERLKEITEQSEKAREEASKQHGGTWWDTMSRGMAIAGAGESGMGMDQIEAIMPSKALTSKTKEIADSMQRMFKNVKDGVYTSSAEITAEAKRIQEAMKLALADPAQAASAETLQQSWKVLATEVASYANTLDRITQDTIDRALEEHAQSWSKNVAEMGINMQKFKAAFGDRFGQDYDTDSKAIDGTIKMYEKLWAASDEGKKEANASKKAQIDNMNEILNLKETMLTAEILIQTNQLETVKTSTKARIEQYIAEQNALLRLGQISEEVAMSRIADASMTRESVTKSADAAIASLSAQLKAFQEQKATMMKRQKAIGDQFDKEAAKGTKKGGDGSLAGQSGLDSIKNQAQQATDALESVKSKYAELMQRHTGDTSAAKIEKERGQTLAQTNKIITQEAKLWADIARMKSGPLRESAVLEYQQLVATNAQTKEYLQKNLEINTAIIEREQLLNDLNLKAENARNRGDAVGSYQAQIDAINIKLQQQLSIEERISLEYKRRILEMRASNDMFGLANEQMNQWMVNTRESAQDTFANAFPNAIDSTISSFSDLFGQVVAGTMAAKDAWSSFGQSMMDIGKQMISMLVKVALQMMVLKMFKAAGFGFADGGVVGAPSAGAALAGSRLPGAGSFSFGSPQVELADGGVLSGGRLTKFASGGVLTAPTFFGMSGGGLGVAGEAGPEAFVPLGRTRDGKLGIETTGGAGMGGGNITLINNNYFDMSGQSGGGGGQGGADNNAMSDSISDSIYSSLKQFVAQELMVHMRPGGLLNRA